MKYLVSYLCRACKWHVFTIICNRNVQISKSWKQLFFLLLHLHLALLLSHVCSNGATVTLIGEAWLYMCTGEGMLQQHVFVRVRLLNVRNKTWWLGTGPALMWLCCPGPAVPNVTCWSIVPSDLYNLSSAVATIIPCVTAAVSQHQTILK